MVVAARFTDGGPMENRDLKSIAIDDLWELHERVVAKLTRELMGHSSFFVKWALFALVGNAVEIRLD